MTIIDYLLLGIASAAAIYIVYRLFLGWRNSAFPQEMKHLGSDRLNGSNFESRNEVPNK